MNLQLTIDGRVEPADQVARTARIAPLSDSQHAILRECRRLGTIRPVQAGAIVHGGRTQFGCNNEKTGGIGCCQYASKDGLDAIKRLMARGILEQVSEGLYAPVERD